ncbi:MAG: ribonuclease H-like domain-containing protein [Bryobacteraceae bacterium]
MSGQEVKTPYGCHFETERLYEATRRHGSLDISSLCALPDNLLGAISDGVLPPSPVASWAFLDTETTGLAGGSGTYAFLIGVGRITAEGFRLRQFFMRDLAEEASLLHRLAEHLGEFETLVTYNGKRTISRYSKRAIEWHEPNLRLPGWSISICSVAPAVSGSCAR